MEIAHAQIKILRVVGKFALLGLAVVLFAKLIVPFLILAVVGLLTWFTGRAVYNRRYAFQRVLVRTKETLVHSAAVVFRTGTVARAAARWVGSILPELARALKAILVLAAVLLGCVVQIGWILAWRCVRTSASVLNSALVTGTRSSKEIAAALFRGVRTGCAKAIRMTAATIAGLRNQSSVICGTFVEAASGALIAAMLALILNALPPEHPIDARVCAAALFGAFLGTTVGLSRTTWVKQAEPGQLLENQN